MTILALRPGTDLAFDSEPVTDFSEGWSLLDEHGATTALTLPTRVETEGTVRLTKTVPADIPSPTVLNFRTAHQRVRLYCDGQLLYSFGYDNPAAFGQSPGGAWNMIRLPPGSAGKVLILELESPYSAYRGRIDTIQMGSKAALLFSLVRQHFLSLLLTTIIFVAGLIMLLLHCFVLRKVSSVGRETLCLGLFSVFVSIWLFGEGRVTQFFGVSPALNTCITLLAMMATPIPLVYYLSFGRGPAARRLLDVVAKGAGVLMLGSLALQAFGVLDFIQQLPLINGCFAVVSLLILYAVVVEAVRQPSKEANRLLISLGVLVACFALETVQLYRSRGPVGGMMRLGVLVFIAIQAATALQDATHIMLMSRFASVDALTGCQNRAAYSQWLEELTGEKNVGVVIADINNLKFINDNFGHEVGDEAIIYCARCFSDAFSPSGQCFRIGGDEFAMLGNHLTMERLQGLAETFQTLGGNQAQMTNYPFSVSCGYAVFDRHSDKELSDAINRADQMMYQNKRRMKHTAQPEEGT